MRFGIYFGASLGWRRLGSTYEKRPDDTWVMIMMHTLLCGPKPCKQQQPAASVWLAAELWQRQIPRMRTSLCFMSIIRSRAHASNGAAGRAAWCYG